MDNETLSQFDNQHCFSSTMPPVGPQGERASDKLGSAVGFVLVACGLVFNEWVIARIASSDGQIEATSVRILIWSLDALLVLMGAFIVNYPHYARVVFRYVTSFLSLVACSLVIFAVLEIFPSLIKYMPFGHAHYYAQKARFVPDEELVFRNRPSSRFEIRRFKGNQYRAFYGLDVKPIPYSAKYDEYGFRNGPMPQSGWDVVVLGDSNVEFGQDEPDTFTERLAVLSGLTIRNLGTNSYSPFHYLTVLKRYGLIPKPRYVLFCFSETTDIADIGKYLQWKNSGKGYGGFNLTGRNFLQRYVMALRDVLYPPLVWIVAGVSEDPPAGDLVTIKLGDSSTKAVFSYKNETRTPNELLRTNEWNILKELLGQFKNIATENNIVPIVVFIPIKTHIYAEYTTSDNATNWMAIRGQQIDAKDNTESALRALCRQIGLELVSLSPAFERAASQGKLLYYPFDTHWNSEGRQIGASILAERLSQSKATN
jgi:hypothetical protein